jgi:hypothetical protein
MRAAEVSSATVSSFVFGRVASGAVGDKLYFTGLALLNPSESDASVTLELFDRTGRLVVSRNDKLPAHRRKSQLLTEYFERLTGQNIGAGDIKVTSDRVLAGCALFGTQGLTALSAVPAQVIP